MSRVAFPAGLCWRCARRGWLLSCLGEALDELAESPSRLWPALELDDRDLIAAFARSDGERSTLMERWEAWASSCVSVKRGVCDGSSAMCRHHCRYPARLRDDPLAPHALVVVSGAAARGHWEELFERKVVAIAGAQSPSGYGAGIARAFATELTAAGVTVAGSASGVGAAARAAAVERGGAALCVAVSLGSSRGEWGDARRPRSRRRRQCTVVEPIAGAKARRWTQLAAERTLALVADLVLVVQAHEQSHLDLACATVACSRGVPVAAAPGPIDSPASRGSNHLLASGARFVCDTSEVLDALFGLGGDAPTAFDTVAPARDRHRSRLRRGRATRRLREPSCDDEARPAALSATQRAVLDLLGADKRTLAQLGHDLGDEGQAAIALAELELLGVAHRGDDGRYRTTRAGHLR